MKGLIFTFALSLLLLSGCSLLPHSSSKSSSTISSIQTIEQRNQQMDQLASWNLSGKIAFIQKNKRESANLFWQQKEQNEQTLNLTTYLGINVLQLNTFQGIHTLTVDGKTYQSKNLSALIYQLTGLQLPTEALAFWLKGLAYLPSDNINYHDLTLLPTSLTSQFNGLTWNISYADYQNIQQHHLATKLTIRQDQLTIKININQWNI